MSAYPSRHVAELAKWGKRLGITYNGLAQSGHAQFVLPNGERYSTSATPSDINATNTVKREVCQKLGIRYDTGKRSGSHRKGMHMKTFVPATERVESKSAQCARLLAERRDLCERIKYLQSVGDMESARQPLHRVLEITTEIERLGFRASPPDIRMARY